MQNPTDTNFTIYGTALEEKTVVTALQACVQHRTFADSDSSVFRAFHKTLSELFPQVFSLAKIQVIKESALLLCLQGAQTERPLLFLSHLDVVPARFLDQWKHPPFLGIKEDGYVYGRGTLDMKGHLCALLTAANSLLQEGWRPKGDIYFAFSADEETRGNTMKMLCDLLRSKGVSPAFVLDEGGFVTPYTKHHKAPAALIGVGEKGHIRFDLSASQDIGAERLLHAGRKLSKLRFKPRFTQEVQNTLHLLSSTSSGRFAWLSKRMHNPYYKNWLLKMMARSKADASSVCSQISLQKLMGDALYYEMPKLVYYVSLLHGDNAEAFIQKIKKLLKRNKVTITMETVEEPSLISPSNGPAWDALTTAIQVHFPHVPIVPYLLSGGTDARHMEKICTHVYRFSPFVVTSEELACIHHPNERISVENLVRGVQFFKQMLQA